MKDPPPSGYRSLTSADDSISTLLVSFSRQPDSGSIEVRRDAGGTTSVRARNAEGGLRTIAYMIRGEGYQEKLAISGLAVIPHTDLPFLIDNGDRLWRPKALIARVHHKTIADPARPNLPADFHTTHAGKQLIAYFVHKHVITIEDRARYYSFISKAGPNRTKVCNLDLDLPPHALKGCDIYVSLPMCEDCKDFLKRVNTTFGIQIRVIENATTVREAITRASKAGTRLSIARGS